MEISALAKRIIGCLLFVLAIQIPISFGFSKPGYQWLIDVEITGYFFAAITLTMLLLKRKGRLDAARVNRDLLSVVCLCLGMSVFTVHNAGVGAFASAMYTGALYGKVDLRTFRNTRYLMIVGLFVMATACLKLFVFKSFTVLDIGISALLFVVGGFAGEVFGALLNHCVPPLLRVWRELKAVGPVLGGYSLGYVLVSIVFAGCYASLNRLDSHAIRGLGTSGSFIDYWYYSVSVLTTIGSDANPVTALAKIAVGAEVFCGIAWTVVVFSLVLAAAHRINQTK